MRAPVASRTGRSRGQAMVEFALVVPVLFLLLFAIIEGGRFIFYYETLNNATREGTRYAIVHGEKSKCPSGPGSDCDPGGLNVAQRVRSAAFGVLGPSLTVDTSSARMWPDGNQWGDKVVVHATYTYSTLIPIVPLPDITIQAESTGVINY